MNYEPGSSVMPFESSNATTRLSATTGNREDDSMISLSSSPLDYFFPLLDELSRFAPPSPFFSLLTYLIITTQWYATCFFPFFEDYWDFKKYPDKILRYITYIADLGCGDEDIYLAGVIEVIVPFCGAFVLLWTIWLMLIYQWNKSFNRNLMYISRFLYSFVVPIILIPSAFNLGFSIHWIDSEWPSYYIGVTFCQSVSILFLTFVFYLDIIFRSSTPYLEDTVLSMWDGRPIFGFIFGNELATFLSMFLYGFPTWAKYLFFIAYIAYTIVVLLRLLLLPMIHHYMNIIISSAVSAGIFSALLQFFHISSSYRFFLPIGVFFIGIPSYYVIYRHIRREALKNPNLSSSYYAIRTLRVQIAEQCAEFIKFKLVKTITSKCPTTRVLSAIMQMLSFFPSESQLLNLFIGLLNKRTDLKVEERFMFYQVRRVHFLRQTANSQVHNDDVSEVHKATSRAISVFSHFLTKVAEDKDYISFDILLGLEALQRKSSAKCKEAIEKYPNSCALLYEYSRLLIECYSDYRAGMKFFQKGILMERGRYTPMDFAFRSMVNLFPNYLKLRILDYKGKTIINRHREKKSGSSISDDSSSSFSGFDTNININLSSSSSSLLGGLEDFEEVEDLASRLFEKPKLRFTLKKAVAQMKCPGRGLLVFSTVLRFVFIVVFCSIMINYSQTFFLARQDNFQLIEQIGTLRLSYDKSILRFSHMWARNLGLLPDPEKIFDTLKISEPCPNYMNLSKNVDQKIFQYSLESLNISDMVRRNMTLLDSINQYNISTKNKTSYFGIMPMTFCSMSTTFLDTSQMTSTNQISPYFFQQVINLTAKLNQKIDPMKWKNINGICEIITNFNTYTMALNDQSTIFVYFEDHISKSFQKLISMVYYFAVPISFVVFASMFFGGFFLLQNSFQKIFDVLNLMPTELYKEATKPIALMKKDDPLSSTSHSNITESSTNVEYSSFKRILLIFSATISILLSVLIVFYYPFVLNMFDTRFVNLVKWLEIGSTRAPFLIESITNAYLSAIFHCVGETLYTSHDIHDKGFFLYRDQMIRAHQKLIWGEDDGAVFPPCNEFDQRLDNIHFTSSCLHSGDDHGVNKYDEDIQEEDNYGEDNQEAQMENKKDNSTQGIHRGYECLSIDQLILTYAKLSYDLNQDENKTISSKQFIHLQHLGLTHLYPKLIEAQNILYNGLNTQISRLKYYVLEISVVIILMECILFLLEIFLEVQLLEGFKILKILISRLPPINVIQSETLVELIIGRKSNIKDNSSPEKSLVEYSANPIILISNTGQILKCNNSALATFGVTKEQLIGSQIGKVISKEYCPFLIDTAEKMKKGSLDSVQPASFQGIRDDGKLISIESYIIYVAYDDVFVLLMKDKTAINENKEAIEESRKEISLLIEKLIPLEIIKRRQQVNQRPNEDLRPNESQTMMISEQRNEDKNMAFSTKNAACMTLRIANYDEYIPSLSGQQINSQISTVFSSFDTLMGERKDIMKIDVFNTTYYAVSGLFGSDLKEATNELLRFAIECIRSLEEINHNIESSLIASVGIHAGGNLTAGLLGKGSLIFEVVGEVFSLSKCLQAESCDNVICIAQETYELVKDNEEIEIESCGTVRLCARTVTNLYRVSPKI